MSFKMVSVKLLATQEGTNRCPCSFFPLQIRFCDSVLFFCLSFFYFGMFVSFSTATTAGVLCHLFCHFFSLSSLFGLFLFSFSPLQLLF